MTVTAAVVLRLAIFMTISECAYSAKLQSAVVFGNNHAAEFLLFDVVPDFLRQIFAIMGNIPVIQHRAQVFQPGHQ